MDRRADIDLDWNLSTFPLALQILWQHGLHSYDFSTSGRSLQSTTLWELNLPIRWKVDDAALFSIIPGYRRSLEIGTLETGSGDYASDASLSFRRIYSQSYLYEQIPFLELFSENAENDFIALSGDLEELQKADYNAEAYIQLSRRFSSRIRDLFLPSYLELVVNKKFVKEEDLVDLYNTYSLTTRSTAVNLFGDFGAYPLFLFYRTDEFTGALTLNYVVGRRLEMILDHFFSFVGNSDNELTFENRLSLFDDLVQDVTEESFENKPFWSDTVKFLYTWFRYPETGVKLPLIPEKVGEQGYWSHLDSLELKLGGKTGQSSYHPLNIILSHESSLILPDYGEINAEISAGFDVEKTEQGQRYWRFGFSGGIGVQIEF
jgi:hypothetical protein